MYFSILNNLLKNKLCILCYRSREYHSVNSLTACFNLCYSATVYDWNTLTMEQNWSFHSLYTKHLYYL